jgi:hypothetical protein
MDIVTALTAVTASLGLTVAGFYWVGQTLMQHQLARFLEKRKVDLAKELETHKLALNEQLEHTKGELQRMLARDKSAIDGLVRQEVDSKLGELAAQRQYEYDARRRLYVAIGPLRFQLLLACRDLAGRVVSYAEREAYEMSLDRYFGRSTAYRILRPIAITELVEEQVALTDFSIDEGAVDCLRFRRTATRIFSGDEIPGSHPKADWSAQEEHVFADSLQLAARALIAPDGKRVVRFDEFCNRLDTEGLATIAPFDQLLSQFSIERKPILWLRLVAWGNACNGLIGRLGDERSFPPAEFPVRDLLERARDPIVSANLDDYQGRIEALRLISL